MKEIMATEQKFKINIFHRVPDLEIRVADSEGEGENINSKK